MLTKVQRKIIRALRSGKYQQGKGALRRNNQYCCLGVMCDQAKKVRLKVRYNTLRDVFAGQDIGMYDGQITELPFTVQQWVGLRTATGATHGNKESLMSMNDRGLSFLEIADWMESEPPGLFITEEPRTETDKQKRARTSRKYAR